MKSVMVFSKNDLEINGTCEKLFARKKECNEKLEIKLDDKLFCDRCKDNLPKAMLFKRKSKKARSCLKPWECTQRNQAYCSSFWNHVESTFEKKDVPNSSAQNENAIMTRRRPRRAKKVSLSPNLTIDSVQTIPRTPPTTHVRRRSMQSDMVNSPALSQQKHPQKKRDSKQTPSFLKTAREKLTRAVSSRKKAGSWNIRPHTNTCNDTDSTLPSFIQKQNSTSPTIIDLVPATRREASPCAGSSSEPPPSEINVNQNLFGAATSVEEGDPAIISVQSAIKIILKEVRTGKDVDKRICGLAVEIMKQVKAKKHGASAVIAMNYSLPDQTKGRLVQHFLRIPKCNALREGEETKLWKTNKNKLNWINPNIKLLGDLLNTICDPNDKQLQKKIINGFVKSIGGAVVWESNGSLLDVIDCMTLQNMYSLSTNKIQALLYSIEKLSDNKIKIGPTRLKAQIGDIERHCLLECVHKSVTVAINDTESAECVFYYIPNIPLLLEMMIATAIVEGKMENSIDFSNYIDTVVVSRGIDKGGEDVLDMWRVVNQKGGNDGNKVVPAGVLEGAAETHANLEATILDPARNKMSKLLEQRKPFFVTFDLKDLITGKSFDARSAAIQFEGLGNDGISFDCETISEVRMSVCHPRNLGSTAEQNDFREQAVYAKDSNREVPSAIQLEPAMVTNMIITLPIRLVTIISPRDEEKDEEEYHEIVGFEVLSSTNSNEIIYAFRFASPMGFESTRIQNSAIDVKCYKSVLIYSDDGKMMNMLYGLGTCSATYNCPNCLRKHNSRSVATWLREFRQFLPDDVVFEDFELRSGERNGYDACSSRANAILGENKEYITGPSNTKANIEATKSVLNKALRVVCPTTALTLYYDALHAHQGIVSHLTTFTNELLNAITSTAPDSSSVAQMTEKAMEISQETANLEKSEVYKESVKFFRREKKMITEEEKRYLDYMERSARNQDLDPQESKRLKDIHEDHRKAHHIWAKRSGHSRMTKKIKGGKAFLDLNSNKNKRHKKFQKLNKLNQASYLFRKAMRNEAGHFNKQHGGLELTGRRGMKMLEGRKRIKEIVSQAYDGRDEAANTQVRDLMTWWEKCANHAYEFGLILKSQKKVEGERLYQLKKHFAQFLGLWYEKATDKTPQYYKLHSLMCITIPFAKRTGMAGRPSAEAFENKHHWMNILKALLSPLPHTGLRVRKLSQRQQVYLLPGISERKDKIAKKSVRLGERGEYKTKGTQFQQTENIDKYDPDGEHDMIPDEEGFIEIDDCLIHKDVIDMYLFYTGGKVPDVFSSPIDNREDLGTKVKYESKYDRNTK